MQHLTPPYLPFPHPSQDSCASSILSQCPTPETGGLTGPHALGKAQAMLLGQGPHLAFAHSRETTRRVRRSGRMVWSPVKVSGDRRIHDAPCHDSRRSNGLIRRNEQWPGPCVNKGNPMKPLHDLIQRLSTVFSPEGPRVCVLRLSRLLLCLSPVCSCLFTLVLVLESAGDDWGTTRGRDGTLDFYLWKNSMI